MTAELAALPDAIEAALRRLEGRVVRTELRHSEALSRRLGVEVHLKLECHQKTGSFKFRPALNSVLAALEERADCAFVTSSSGNFGIAAAEACRLVGRPLKLVMMPSASNHKATQAASKGAEIVNCRDDYAAREELVRELVERESRLPLHPHDSLETVAGDATVGIELAEQLPGLGAVIVPTSGAGLLAGVASGLRFRGLDPEIHSVQPSANASLRMSLDAGERRRREHVVTMADGLTAAVPGRLGFAFARSGLKSLALIEEEEMPPAMRLLEELEGLRVEPASATPLAALLAGKIVARGPVVLVLSGANIEAERFDLLTRS